MFVRNHNVRTKRKKLHDDCDGGFEKGFRVAGEFKFVVLPHKMTGIEEMRATTSPAEVFRTSFIKFMYPRGFAEYVIFYLVFFKSLELDFSRV